MKQFVLGTSILLCLSMSISAMKEEEGDSIFANAILPDEGDTTGSEAEHAEANATPPPSPVGRVLKNVIRSSEVRFPLRKQKSAELVIREHTEEGTKDLEEE